MRYIKQLTEHHEKQGLYGDELECAVKADADLVIENVRSSGCNPETFIDEDDGISCLFDWGSSPEGHDYWEARDPG